MDAVSAGVDAGWKYAVAAFKSLFAR